MTGSDGKRAVAIKDDANIYRWDLPATTAKLIGKHDACWSAGLSPDGKLIALSRGKILDVDTGKEPYVLEPHRIPLHEPPSTVAAR